MTKNLFRSSDKTNGCNLSKGEKPSVPLALKTRRAILALSLSAGTALAYFLRASPRAYADTKTSSEQKRAKATPLTKQGVTYSNPKSVHKPGGSYSHSAMLPVGAATLFISGQVGVRPDGSLGGTVAEQADQAFENIRAILETHDMTPSDIVKLTTYVVVGQSGSDVREVRARHLGNHKPTATFIFVPQLYAPEWLIEIEAIAARQ